MVPAWVIVTSWPPIVSVAVRGSVSTCGSTVTSMTFSPEPCELDIRVHCGASVLASQSHLVLRVICLVPPLTGNDSAFESTLYRQLWTAGGVLVRRTPWTASGSLRKTAFRSRSTPTRNWSGRNVLLNITA